MGVTRRPLITTIGLGSACLGTPLIHPCRLDDGIHAVDTSDKHHPDPDYALDGLHPFRSWLRTMNPAQPPSEAVVARALRNTLPEFLLDKPEEYNFKKFILDRTDFERCPRLQLAA